MPHAVSVLRAARLASATKPFMARGGFKRERCEGCRLVPTHCMCVLQRSMNTHAAVCLLMADIEPLKPTNTGWLIADLIDATFAFAWSRTQPDPAFLALLNNPTWDCYVVFPGQYAAPERVVHTVETRDPGRAGMVKRPLFILLDGTWSEARKMFGRSPCLQHLPVLTLGPDEVSRYRLRRSRCADHFCTSEVAALCLRLAGDAAAGRMLTAYLDVFTHHYLQAKNQRPIDWQGAAHQCFNEILARQGEAEIRRPLDTTESA